MEKSSGNVFWAEVDTELGEDAVFFAVPVGGEAGGGFAAGNIFVDAFSAEVPVAVVASAWDFYSVHKEKTIC